jgi:PAS domain S-box-containing protein
MAESASKSARRAQDSVPLDALFARSPFVAVLGLDREGRVLYANAACAQILGEPHEALPGRELATLLAGDAAVERFRRLLGEALAHTHPSAPIELPLRSDGGEERWILLSLQHLEERAELACLAVDITRHKRTEHALRQAAEGFSNATGERFFRSLVEHLARTLGVDFAFVGQLSSESASWVEGVAMWSEKRHVEGSFGYDLAGSPFEAVVQGAMCRTPEGAQETFPSDKLLAEMGVESCLGTPLSDSDGKTIGMLAVLHTKPLREPDLAAYTLQIFAARAASELERKREERRQELLEEQLRRSQKLEAVGTLAGGVAHDFNNLMTAVLGHAYLIKESAAGQAEILRAAEVIEKTAERAADLTRKLLGFARQGRTQNVPLDLHALVRDVQELLSRTLDENIQIESELLARSSVVRGDPDQIHQVLLNLALNGRDAMPAGGVLLFQTDEVTLPAQGESAPLELAPGEYLRLAVSDTGVGIAQEVRERIFEPFFTTKQVGQGSGLGLAMAYGILHSHGGAIEVESEPGAGATFRIYLPLAPA